MGEVGSMNRKSRKKKHGEEESRNRNGGEVETEKGTSKKKRNRECKKGKWIEGERREGCIVKLRRKDGGEEAGNIKEEQECTLI